MWLVAEGTLNTWPNLCAHTRMACCGDLLAVSKDYRMLVCHNNFYVQQIYALCTAKVELVCTYWLYVEVCACLGF